MTKTTRVGGTALSVALAATALGVACSNNGNGNGAAPGGFVGGACGDVVAAICNKTNECNPTEIAREYGTVDACIMRSGLTCAQFDQLTGTSWTADKLAACAGAIRASSCQAEVDVFDTDPCKTTPGSLPSGSPCGDSSQCSGGHCNKTLRIDGGTVQATRCGVCDAATSSNCGDAGTCNSSQTCTFVSATGYACVTPAGEGATCGPGGPCATGLTCKNMICAKRLAELSPCSSTSDCDTSVGLTCINGTCQMPIFVSPGQRCNSLDTRCTGTSDCIAAMGSDAGRSCVLRAADNAPCDDIYGPRCTSPAQCTNGKCALPDYSQCR